MNIRKQPRNKTKVSLFRPRTIEDKKRSGYLASAFSCVLYAVALGYHNYCVFVGYNALPFLENTEFFLYPATAACVLAPFAILVAFNPTRFVLGVYFGDVALS